MGKIQNSLVGLLIGTGLAFGVGPTWAGDNLFNKRLDQMSPSEISQYNFIKSQNTYHTTPKEQRGESLQDYQVRGGDLVNPEGVKETEGQNNSQNGLSERVEEPLIFCGNYLENKQTQIIKEGERFNCWVNFYRGYGDEKIKRKMKIINKKEIIHSEENNTKIESARQFVYPNKEGIILNKGEYEIILSGKTENGDYIYSKSFIIKVEN